MIPPAMLIIVGVFTIAAPADALYRMDEQLIWASCLVFCIGLLVISYGSFLLILEPYSTSIIDRQEHNITITNNNWNRLRGSAKQLRFSEVKNIDIIMQQNKDGIPLYKVQLILYNGEKVPLSTKWEKDGCRCKRVRTELMLWLRLRYR